MKPHNVYFFTDSNCVSQNRLFKFQWNTTSNNILIIITAKLSVLTLGIRQDIAYRTFAIPINTQFHYREFSR